MPPPRFDRFRYYELAVQEPEHVMRNIAKTFRRLAGREARVLREDFCSTFANAEAWVLRHQENRAVGVDLDPEPLAWGRQRRLVPGSDIAKRLRAIQGNVLDQRRGSFDIVAALNFSWMVFKTPETLGAYFDAVRGCLARDGMFCLDVYGGPDTQRKTEDHSRMGGFSYYWEQKSWDAITGETQCAIHFRLSDGRKRRNVFTYDWRLWTLAETMDHLKRHGFEILEVQDEVSSSVARGASVWRPVKRLSGECFVANIYARVARKKARARARR